MFTEWCSHAKTDSVPSWLDLLDTHRHAPIVAQEGEDFYTTCWQSVALQGSITLCEMYIRAFNPITVGSVDNLSVAWSQAACTTVLIVAAAVDCFLRVF